MDNKQRTRSQAENFAIQDYRNARPKNAARYDSGKDPIGEWAKWYNDVYDKLIELREAVAPVDQSEEQ